MSERVTYSFSDVAEFKKGINYSSTDYVEGNTGIPFISIKCLLKGGGFDFTGIKFLKDRFENSDKLKTGELLFSITDLTRAGDIVGSPLLVPEKYNGSVASMDLIRVKPNELLLNTEYLYYLMMTNKVRNYFVNHSAGSTVLHLEIASIPKLIINLPLLTQQRKIARILSTADAVIEKTQAAIAKYKAIKQGMLHDLFTRGIDINTGKLRPKYADAPALYKDSSIGFMPVEWEEKPLEELTTQIGDGIHTTPKYSENTDFYFINGNNLTDGEIDIAGSALCISEEEYKKHFKELNNRTILYSINGTIGNIAFYKNQKVVLGKSACYISCKPNVNLDYIFFILQSHPVFKFYEIEMTGSTIKNLSLASVRNTPITIPKEDKEQELIANRIRTINNKLNTEQNYLFKLQHLKAGLMGDLLSGRKRVTVPEEVLTQTEN